MFILKSASPRRKEILKKLGIKFQIDPAKINEDAIEKFKLESDHVSIWLKQIDKEIKIQLSENFSEGGTNYHLSHAIKTPEQMSAYISSREWGDYPAYALHMAVTSITQYYNIAIRNGHTPSGDWLVSR